MKDWVNDLLLMVLVAGAILAFFLLVRFSSP
jgi:hypothetical protein